MPAGLNRGRARVTRFALVQLQYAGPRIEMEVQRVRAVWAVSDRCVQGGEAWRLALQTRVARGGHRSSGAAACGG